MSGKRNGRGGKAHLRASARLKRETQAKGLVCAWCGEPIDTSLPYNNSMAFTADHPVPVSRGGQVIGQKLVPMHRKCNTAKGDHEEPDIGDWGAS